MSVLYCLSLYCFAPAFLSRYNSTVRLDRNFVFGGEMTINAYESDRSALV